MLGMMSKLEPLLHGMTSKKKTSYPLVSLLLSELVVISPSRKPKN
jgi:hypothetical protein